MLVHRMRQQKGAYELLSASGVCHGGGARAARCTKTVAPKQCTSIIRNIVDDQTPGEGANAPTHLGCETHSAIPS